MSINPAALSFTGDSAIIDIGKPRYFTLLNKLLGTSLQFILVFFPLMTVMALTSFCLMAGSLILFPVIISFLFIFLGLLAYFLPHENLWASWIVRKVHGVGMRPPDTFTVQITLSPRVCSGFEGYIDDADSIGLLTLTNNRILFLGDSIQLVIPFASIISLDFKRPSHRLLFAGSKRIMVSFHSDKEYHQVCIACREKYSLPAARAADRHMIERLHRRMDDWMMKDAGVVPSKPMDPEHRFPLG